jgi:ATP-dependent helicase/nuclease subunit B
MPDGTAERPTVFTIPIHRSFADALAAGVMARFGRDPLELAAGRILLPNNRAVRAVTDAFVRISGGGLLLPRLIPIGDPELDDRIGGALDPIDQGDPVLSAIDPLERLLTLASIVDRSDESSSEILRLAADLARALDALLIEEVAPTQLRRAVSESDEIATHWERSLEKLQLIYEAWPAILSDRGAVDLPERRNRLLRRMADRWKADPPPGFTIAAGVTTAAPAVAALLARVARMPGGMVVLPGLSLSNVMPDAEWDALGADQQVRGEETHPQFHLKLLLDRMGVARGEVQSWRQLGRSASSPTRTHAVANALTSPDFSHKWQTLRPAERRLSGVRLAKLPDTAAEAQAIALALREALETPGKTAALITPDRQLAARVSALLERWGIEADDSAGTPLSQTPVGTLLLGIASAAAEELAPVPLLALAKHPLVGGGDEQRLAWLEAARELDLRLRGPRPAAGLAGLDAHFGALSEWRTVRDRLASTDGLLANPLSLSAFIEGIVRATEALTEDAAWRGPAGRMAAELLAEIEASEAAVSMTVDATAAVAVLRDLLDQRSVRLPYGGHPRIFIWGLLEARLQRADLVILGGLNEGVWPALPAPDPWLPPKVRANLGMPGLEFRIGLSAHDFASALGAPEVLITRARRDSRSPTIASRFLLRLDAMSGGLPRDIRLERLVRAIDDPGPPQPVSRPEPAPPPAQRPDRISVTAVDRLNADPFAFYAQAILKLHAIDPVDDDHTARWKGIAVHQALQEWLQHDECDPGKLRPRAEQLLRDEAVHPMLRALWSPRLLEAIDWIAALERDNRAMGRRPLAAEVTGETPIAGVTVHGRVDRIDRLGDGSLAIIDYKTGAPPTQKAVNAGFALQLGLLGLIGRAGGFEGVSGDPVAFEYWSLTRHKGKFGKLMCPDKDMQPGEFLDHAYAHFKDAAGKWLTGSAPFTAKLNPAYAPYGDYDQLMRLEEWYGRK